MEEVEEMKFLELCNYAKLLESIIDERGGRVKRMLENRSLCKWIVKHLPNLTGEAESELLEIMKGKTPYPDVVESVG